ncbi:4Fe-4S dicluster domain-containing protein [candidate division GN15 bacterium]|nr:4Fe-4S dicluster domain-containing protein [candidate division GN15 bacterium]
MAINRRNFFKLAAAGSTALAVGKAHADDSGLTVDCSDNYGVLVDTAVCIGCRRCELACDQEHTKSGRPPESFDDKSVYEKHRRPNKDAFTVVNEFADPAKPDDKYTMKVQCMHCNDPACASACLVGALRKDAAGPVVYEEWRCIGCRYCMVACPFQIPTYEYDKALEPRVRKCTFCYERITEEGQMPACVAICPNEALTFGTRQRLLEVAHYRIKSHPERYVDHVYGEKEAGGTSWMYLAPAEFAHTELPRLDHSAIPTLTETIQHGIFKSFLPPLALYGLLGLIMHSTREKKDRSEESSNHD